MHTISTFSKKIFLMDNGKYQLFDNVSEGIKSYRRIFAKQNDRDIQRVCNGNEKIRFYDVRIANQILHPGDSFYTTFKYESVERYSDIEIDITIYSSNEPGLHFQATNKAYSKKINLEKGSHMLKVGVEDIKASNATGTIGLAIWSNDRSELLFWWRIPVEFTSAKFSTGNNFYNMYIKSE
jgi:hypothetical protein